MGIVCLGEILIDMFPAEVGRKLVNVSSFFPNPGGSCANVAVALARLGKSSSFIGKVGDDFFGSFLIDTLKNNGVEISGMRVDEKARTTLAFIAMPDENSAEFIFYRNPGADLCLKPEDIDLQMVKNAQVFHCSSLTLVDEPARSAQFMAAEAAKNSGVIISYDVNFRPKLWRSQADAIMQTNKMIAFADLVKVNEVELELLTGSRDPKQGGEKLLSQGIKLVAVTLGKNGSYFLTTNARGLVAPFEVKTIDAIGCGDAFMGAVLSRLAGSANNQLDLSEGEIRKIFTFANASGALTALKHGVIPALPTEIEVIEFLKERSIIEE